MNAVAKGLPRDTAARLARIHPSTLYDWLRRGRSGDRDYSEFSERVREAESRGEAELVDQMRSHAKLSWQACAWLLSSRRPNRWGPRKPEAPTAVVPGTIATSTEEQLSHAESVVAALRSAS